MSKFTYKTVDGTQTGYVTGIGAITNGTISSDSPIENPNLKLIDSDSAAVPAAPVVGTASQQNPNQPATAGDAQTDTGKVTLS